ncbi:MAG: hypothetical protein LPH21_19345 [Shewanella sp.]|nr:hypothetical protein [Shewanella sp.]MCF1431145.1 hypothetical protein [Shewanella sp.]MCF1459618.1 hypothetical protein [Shewanella sp.]
MALFHVLIARDNGVLITSPNSLMLQKSVLKLASKKPDRVNSQADVSVESRLELQGAQSSAQ